MSAFCGDMLDGGSLALLANVPAQVLPSDSRRRSITVVGGLVNNIIVSLRERVGPFPLFLTPQITPGIDLSPVAPNSTLTYRYEDYGPLLTDRIVAFSSGNETLQFASFGYSKSPIMPGGRLDDLCGTFDARCYIFRKVSLNPNVRMLEGNNRRVSWGYRQSNSAPSRWCTSQESFDSDVVWHLVANRPQMQLFRGDDLMPLMQQEIFLGYDAGVGPPSIVIRLFEVLWLDMPAQAL